MSEIIAEEIERNLWLEDKIKYVRYLFSEWLLMARDLKYSWNALIEAGEWVNIFEEEPKTEERLRLEELNVRDERCWKLLTNLWEIMKEVDIQIYTAGNELEKRIKQSAGYKFDINRDLSSTIKLIKHDIHQELPGVKVSVVKGGFRHGCIGSITVTIKEIGSYVEEELWCEITDIIRRYNRTEACYRDCIGFEIIHDVQHAWGRAIEHWERTGEPVPEGLQRMKYETEKLEKKKAERRKGRELKKTETGALNTGQL